MSDIAALTVQLVIILVRFKQGRDAGCYVSTAKVVTEVETFSPSSEKPRASTLLHIPGNHPARGAAQFNSTAKIRLELCQPGKASKRLLQTKAGLEHKVSVPKSTGFALALLQGKFVGFFEAKQPGSVCSPVTGQSTTISTPLQTIPLLSYFTARHA